MEGRLESMKPDLDGGGKAGLILALTLVELTIAACTHGFGTKTC